MKKLLFVLLLVGCGADDTGDYYYSNGQYVGTHWRYFGGDLVINYRGIEYRTDLDKLIIESGPFVYLDGECSTPYVDRAKIKGGLIAHYDGYDLYYAHEETINDEGGMGYELVDGVCLQKALTNTYLSIVKTIPRFDFLDSNLNFIHKPIKE